MKPSIFSLSKIASGMVAAVLMMGGCSMPAYVTKLDSRIINEHNDQRFLGSERLECPASLKNQTVALKVDISRCIKPMGMEGISAGVLGQEIKPLPIPYAGNPLEDIVTTLKRNLTQVCGTRFSEDPKLPSIDITFSKLTSQVLSIDKKHDVENFNLIKLDSQYDYNVTTNYVAEAQIGGSFFPTPWVYARGLTKEEVVHIKEEGTNYLVSVSTRGEKDHTIHFLTFPDVALLYSQKNVMIMDMKTIIVPIMSNEFMVKYELYAPDGSVQETKTLSLQSGGMTSDFGFNNLQVQHPSDRALVALFGNSGIGFWDGSAPAGPYGWLMYDLTQAVLHNAH
jgi:hypothetical protein